MCSDGQQNSWGTVGAGSEQASVRKEWHIRSKLQLKQRLILNRIIGFPLSLSLHHFWGSVTQQWPRQNEGTHAETGYVLNSEARSDLTCQPSVYELICSRKS